MILATQTLCIPMLLLTATAKTPSMLLHLSLQFQTQSCILFFCRRRARIFLKPFKFGKISYWRRITAARLWRPPWLRGWLHPSTFRGRRFRLSL